MPNGECNVQDQKILDNVESKITKRSVTKVDTIADSDINSRTPQATSAMWRSTVHTSQEEFKRQGWNLAGSNLLALAVGLASRHYLYVRPRLTPRDFAYACAPMLVGLALASLIAYCAYGTAVLPQMAALGAVLGLLGITFCNTSGFTDFLNIFNFIFYRNIFTNFWQVE